MEEREQNQEYSKNLPQDFAMQDGGLTRGSEKERAQESLKIQKAEWIYSQIQKQREAEDALFEQMRQEQEVLDRLNQSMERNMERTKEARKYNREFQEHMDAQVYAMYGITEDKLQGIREYRNAYYQGCAFSLFLLSVVLVVLCGVLHGFQSQICLFMIAFSGIEGTLLAQEKRRGKVLGAICKILYLLMFPLMMVVFVCFELGYQEYYLILPWLAVFGICVLAAGTVAYFCYNPYRKEKRKVGEARDALREIEKTARKEVRKNQKSREKEEKQQKKLLSREAARQQKQLEKEEKQRQKRLEKEEKQQQKSLIKEEKQQQLLQVKNEKQQELLEKKDNLLSRFQKRDEKSEAVPEEGQGELEAVPEERQRELEAVPEERQRELEAVPEERQGELEAGRPETEEIEEPEGVLKEELLKPEAEEVLEEEQGKPLDG